MRYHLVLKPAPSKTEPDDMPATPHHCRLVCILAAEGSWRTPASHEGRGATSGSPVWSREVQGATRLEVCSGPRPLLAVEMGRSRSMHAPAFKRKSHARISPPRRAGRGASSACLCSNGSSARPAGRRLSLNFPGLWAPLSLNSRRA